MKAEDLIILGALIALVLFVSLALSIYNILTQRKRAEPIVVPPELQEYFKHQEQELRIDIERASRERKEYLADFDAK